MSNLKRSAKLPAAIEDKLRSIRRRQMLFVLLRGASVALCVLIVAMICAMAIDWSVTLYDTRVRGILTIGALMLAAAALLVASVPPFLRAMRWIHAARDADGVVPALEERWTTVASFADSGHAPGTEAGRAMLQQVVSEASAMERLVQPGRIAPPAALKSAGLALGACLLGLLGFLSLNWPQTSVLLARFWSPRTNITATQLFCDSEDLTIPRGEMVELTSTLTGIPRAAATLELQFSTDIADTLELTADPSESTKFVHSLRADSSFRYRMRAGDGQTPWHSVTVVDYPALDEVRFTVTAPEYVDRPPYEKQLIPGRVKVVQGSRLDLRLKPVAEVERIDLILGIPQEQGEPREQTVTLVPDDLGWYRYQTHLLTDLSLRPELWSEYGLTNENPATCRIQVIADKPPVARVVSPTNERAVAVDDVIDIQFEAHDDFGIATAELVVYDESMTQEGEQPKVLRVQPIPLGDQQPVQHVMGSTRLDLKELGLAEGAQISYAVRVTDNRMVPIDREPAADQSTRTETQQVASTDAEPSNRSEGAASERTQSEQPIAGSNPDASAQRADREPRLAQADESGGKAASDETSGERRAAPPGAATSETASSAMTSSNAASTEPGAESASEPPPDDRAAVAASRAADGDESDSSGTSAKEQMTLGTADSSSKENAASAPKSQPEGKEVSEGDDSPDHSDPEESSRELAETSPAPPPLGNDSEGEVPDGSDDRPGSSSPGSSPMTSSNVAEGSFGKERGSSQSSAQEDESLAAQAATSPDESNQTPPAGDGQPETMVNEPQVGDPQKAGTSEEPTLTAGEKPGARSEAAPVAEPADTDPASEQHRAREQGARSSALAGATNTQPSATGADAPPPALAMRGQQSQSGQNTETSRRRLKITARLTAIAAASTDRKAETTELRERIVAIDTMLAEGEDGLANVIERRIPDASHGEQYRRVDEQLGEIETDISKLRDETRDSEYAFVGLQMVDIGRTHVSPARDLVFVAARDAGGARRNAIDALQHIVRARELLAALLDRYDRVARDRQLADDLEEAVEMYEVYIEKRHRLMREARQNRNPLERKMSVIEVDQEYLDRYAEVLTLRREMLAEFARMLADDPRLLARYLDQLKRRRASLRDQLTELSERQYEQATELSGWLAVSEQQRRNLWRLIVEMRLQETTELAGDAAELAERIDKQLPLLLDPEIGTAGRVVQHARAAARMARDISFTAQGILQNGAEKAPESALAVPAERLVHQCGELEAVLDQLNVEHETEDEVTAYVASRLLESRAVADQADIWAQIARGLEQQRYAPLAEVDQQRTAIATELLRSEMLDFESELQGQFQQVAEIDVPGPIVDLIRQLHRVMEQITYHQTAATFAMDRDRLEMAQSRQASAVQGFEEAEKLFDRIRRAVIAELDQYDEDDPNIADLEDPTLDEFLARLEREPNIQAQLGIPNRPRNLRVIADTMSNTQSGGDMLGDAQDAAVRRAQEAMKMRRQQEATPPPPAEMSEQERQERQQQQQMQQQLEQALAALKKKMEDPGINDQQRRQLEQMAENMQRMLEQVGKTNRDAQDWRRIAQSDEARAILKALASGEAIPDQQWNKILSTLEDGLWQVRGRTPPEEYRRAIEQYQDRIRQLMDTIVDEAA